MVGTSSKRDSRHHIGSAGMMLVLLAILALSSCASISEFKNPSVDSPRINTKPKPPPTEVNYSTDFPFQDDDDAHDEANGNIPVSPTDDRDSWQYYLPVPTSYFLTSRPSQAVQTWSKPPLAFLVGKSHGTDFDLFRPFSNINSLDNTPRFHHFIEQLTDQELGDHLYFAFQNNQFLRFGKNLPLTIQSYLDFYSIKQAKLGPYKLFIKKSVILRRRTGFDTSNEITIHNATPNVDWDDTATGYGHVFDYGLAFMANFNNPEQLDIVYSTGLATPRVPDYLTSGQHHLAYERVSGLMKVFGGFSDPLISVTDPSRTAIYQSYPAGLLADYSFDDGQLYASLPSTCIFTRSTGFFDHCDKNTLLWMSAFSNETPNENSSQNYFLDIWVNSHIGQAEVKKFAIDTSAPGFPHVLNLDLSSSKHSLKTSRYRSRTTSTYDQSYTFDDAALSRIVVQGRFYGPHMNSLVQIISFDLNYENKLDDPDQKYRLSGWGFSIFDLSETGS